MAARRPYRAPARAAPPKPKTPPRVWQRVPALEVNRDCATCGVSNAEHGFYVGDEGQTSIYPYAHYCRTHADIGRARSAAIVAREAQARALASSAVNLDDPWG
jgi:hypothetical protein